MTKGVKLIGMLSLGAFLVLGGAAVWMGGLNQDEGWYLYAAQMVAEGRIPYRDFAFTQGPMLPMVYAVLSPIWGLGGLLGARLLTLTLGLAGILLMVALARRLVDPDRRMLAGLMTFLLLGSNLYHLYYLAIPKTYALAALLVAVGCYLLALALEGKAWLALIAGLSLAFASGTRISLGALLAVTGLVLLLNRRGKLLAWFCIGGFVGLALVYGPFLLNEKALAGLVEAQRYHAARGGGDIVWTVGSLSRLVRWYLPVFVLLGLWLLTGGAQSFGTRMHSCGLMPGLLALGFCAVFGVQMLAPFPYDDYQVPIMGLATVFVVVVSLRSEGDAHRRFALVLLAMGMTWAGSFGSPLLEKWSTNGQDRFWSIKKNATELQQLRTVARKINEMDPGGTELLTQDLYLAIESGRKVPCGLEMGPFAMLDDRQWRELLQTTTCPVAALSGYAFAIRPPVCDERPIGEQRAYWDLVKRNYKTVLREENFGQNQTTLTVMKRK